MSRDWLLFSVLLSSPIPAMKNSHVTKSKKFGFYSLPEINAVLRTHAFSWVETLKLSHFLKVPVKH